MHVFGYAFLAAFIATAIRLLFFATKSVLHGVTTLTATDACITLLITLVLSFSGVVVALLIKDLWEDI